ncbi:MAG: sulfite exporter TauE/SafE family protein, partial [Methylobacteriaceae bacterium]|nr:sulfite exporter TauE/SafE family protein [Methylobacteriaceae bacterium]
AELFRFLLAILVLGVGLRFAIELVLRPAEPFSISLPDSRR